MNIGDNKLLAESLRVQAESLKSQATALENYANVLEVMVPENASKGVKFFGSEMVRRKVAMERMDMKRWQFERMLEDNRVCSLPCGGGVGYRADDLYNAWMGLGQGKSVNVLPLSKARK